MLRMLRNNERTKIRTFRLGANKTDLSECLGTVCRWNMEGCNAIMAPDSTKTVGGGFPPLVVDVSNQLGRDNRFPVVVTRAG